MMFANFSVRNIANIRIREIYLEKYAEIHFPAISTSRVSKNYSAIPKTTVENWLKSP